jgi:hypothetical protein
MRPDAAGSPPDQADEPPVIAKVQLRRGILVCAFGVRVTLF